MMRGIGLGAVLAVALLALGCSGNTASTGVAPLDEYLCNGRNSVGDVTERIEATSREEAVTKFKQKHTDVPVATCRPNPRQ